MNYKNELEQKGYILLKNIFSKNELNNCKKEIMNYIKNTKTLKLGEGITIPDFIKSPNLQNTINLKNNIKIHNILKQIFNNDYRFCAHNDIGINRIVDWHKDILNNDASVYETINVWNKYNNEKYEIIKILIYLQDHSKNNDGLKLVPKSHLINNYNTTEWIQIYSNIGDVIIFDQRITHRGMNKLITYPRILVSFGFGKNNIFTDNFERGTIFRQNYQKKLKTIYNEI